MNFRAIVTIILFTLTTPIFAQPTSDAKEDAPRPLVPEAIRRMREKSAQDAVKDKISGDISGDVFAKCILAGFDNISDIRHAKDCILVVESIKSLLLKSINIEYTLQEFADRVMVIEDFDLDDEQSACSGNQSHS